MTKSPHSEHQQTEHKGLSLEQLVVLVLGALISIPVMLVIFANLSSDASATGGTTVTKINVQSIGGVNVWWFIGIWFLSQCILVHHARRK